MGIALLTAPLVSAGAASILFRISRHHSAFERKPYFFPASVAQHPQSSAAGQHTTARTTATPKPIVGPTTLQWHGF